MVETKYAKIRSYADDCMNVIRQWSDFKDHSYEPVTVALVWTHKQ